MNDIVETQTLHLRPVVEPLKKFLVALFYELFVSSFCHLSPHSLINICKSNKKNPCNGKRFRDFLYTISLSWL
jgi:hypothetical protein